MVVVCKKAGLREDQLWCLEEAAPTDHSEAVTVATDDVIMIHDDAIQGAARLAALDAAFVNLKALAVAADRSKWIKDQFKGCRQCRRPPK